MKPVWATKVTICRYVDCPYPEREIHIGSRRLTDNVMLDGRLRRIHYHLDCFIAQSTRWFEDNSYEQNPTNNSRGAPNLGITEEARIRRVTILNRLSYLRRTYLPTVASAQASLDNVRRAAVSDPDLVTGALDDINAPDLAVLRRYKEEHAALIAELATPDMGGLTKRYQ